MMPSIGPNKSSNFGAGFLAYWLVKTVSNFESNVLYKIKIHLESKHYGIHSVDQALRTHVRLAKGPDVGTLV